MGEEKGGDGRKVAAESLSTSLSQHSEMGFRRSDISIVRSDHLIPGQQGRQESRHPSQPARRFHFLSVFLSLSPSFPPILFLTLYLLLACSAITVTGNSYATQKNARRCGVTDRSVRPGMIIVSLSNSSALHLNNLYGGFKIIMTRPSGRGILLRAMQSGYRSVSRL